MSRRRIAAAATGLLLAVTAIIAALLARSNSAAAPGESAREKPELLLLSALPIVFPEELTLESAGSPALSALERRYRVRPISTAHAGNLEGQRLLLMAQPQAQTAEALVDLDNWVRGGGRVLLLADPTLQWASELPLGDVRRPPFAFADTGLLRRWGLRLDGPEELGPATVDADGNTVPTLSPGSLRALDGQCDLEAQGAVARCAIGSGKATIIADADFINVAGEPARRANLDLLLRELRRLEQ